MPKYKEIMYVSSMQIDDVSVFFAHDLPHFPYYWMHPMLIRNQWHDLHFDKARTLSSKISISWNKSSQSQAFLPQF